jgi:acyl-coenzyme A thioesterase PaaI-like protein
MPSDFKLVKDVLAMRENWRKRADYGCFWSSPDNPVGLKLTPTIEPGRLFVDMVIDRYRTGFPGIAQGGIAFAILDGLMSWYLMSHLGRGGFTKTAEIAYRRPLKVGTSYRFEVIAESVNLTSKEAVLRGDAYETTASKPEKTCLTMTARFILPSRKLAAMVLGNDLGTDGEELFPDEA